MYMHACMHVCMLVYVCKSKATCDSIAVCNPLEINVVYSKNESAKYLRVGPIAKAGSSQICILCGEFLPEMYLNVYA